MRLKELREKNNLSQKLFAQKINIPYYNYNKYELEKVNIDIKTLCLIADYYNVSLDYLCEHKTNDLIDTSSFSDKKKGCVLLLKKLNEQNATILLGYITHMVQEQNKA